MSSNLLDYLKENAQWFVRSETPMTIEESDEFLIRLIEAAYVQGQRDQLSEQLAKNLKAI